MEAEGENKNAVSLECYHQSVAVRDLPKQPAERCEAMYLGDVKSLKYLMLPVLNRLFAFSSGISNTNKGIPKIR